VVGKHHNHGGNVPVLTVLAGTGSPLRYPDRPAVENRLDGHGPGSPAITRSSAWG